MFLGVVVDNRIDGQQILEPIEMLHPLLQLLLSHEFVNSVTGGARYVSTSRQPVTRPQSVVLYVVAFDSRTTGGTSR